jgi:maltokinase
VIDTERLATELVDLLPEHLGAQRWFGGKDLDRPALAVAAVEVVHDAWPMLVRVEITVETDRYQLLLGLRPLSQRSDMGRAAVGEVSVGDGRAFCFDALVDAELGLTLLHAVAPDVAASVETARPILAEQSNSSLVYDERFILKVFRRLVANNPDVEVTTALAAAGFSHVAEPLAAWRSPAGDDLALLQRFLRGGAEGWALAQTSLRDLFGAGGEADEAGGDFSPEAERLGRITADLHISLADAFGREPGDARRWAATINSRLGDVRRPDLDREALAVVVDRLLGTDDVGSAIRIHGDYHLGQVLHSDDGWFVIDFEGEPIRPGDERRARSSPLRDVAGMLRSFHYASLVAANEHGDHVTELAEAWEARNRAAFVSSYVEGVAGRGLVPSDASAFERVLAAFELDKAVYEVAYEQAHRPDWVAIPLAGLRRLLAGVR